jgi:hypothetical protein
LNLHATATLLHLLLLHSFGGKAGAQLSDLVIDIAGSLAMMEKLYA